MDAYACMGVIHVVHICSAYIRIKMWMHDCCTLSQRMLLRKYKLLLTPDAYYNTDDNNTDHNNAEYAVRNPKTTCVSRPPPRSSAITVAISTSPAGLANHVGSVTKLRQSFQPASTDTHPILHVSLSHDCLLRLRNLLRTYRVSPHVLSLKYSVH